MIQQRRLAERLIERLLTEHSELLNRIQTGPSYAQAQMLGVDVPEQPEEIKYRELSDDTGLIRIREPIES